MTAQLLSVHVPHSTTNLQMGSSVGGPGVSLATAGDVLVDAVGVMDIQSKGAFVGQTSAAMAMLSASVQKVHSQGKVEMFAGGGKSPAACGPGGPAAAADAGPPGATTEKVTVTACAALAAVSAGYGLDDAFTAPAVAPKVISVVVGLAAIKGGGDAGATVGGSVSGGPDIEERASANIKMIAGKKISGIAPMLISATTLGKWEVKALLVTDFTTSVFTNFALAKFEVRALDVFKTSAVVKFEVEGESSVEIKTKEFKGKAAKITMDGATEVTKVMDVMGKTTCHETLTVERNTLLTGTLTVVKKIEVKGTVTVKKNTTVISTVTVDGDVKMDKATFKSSVTLGA